MTVTTRGGNHIIDPMMSSYVENVTRDDDDVVEVSSVL